MAKNRNKTNTQPTRGPNRDMPSGKMTMGPRREACLANKTHKEPTQAKKCQTLSGALARCSTDSKVLSNMG